MHQTQFSQKIPYGGFSQIRSHILSDKMTELYLLFYSHVLHYFVRLNLFLQREEPVIAVVYEQVHWQLHTHAIMLTVCFFILL